MVWKKVTNSDTGTADLFGGNDMDKVSDIFSGVDADDIDFNADIKFRSGKLQVANPANTFKYNVTAAAIAADRTLNLPLITATDTLAVLGLAQTFTAAQTFNSSLLKLRNPADTFSYTVVPAAIAANRNLTLPLLTADDTLATEAFIQTLTNKTINASNNTINDTSIATGDLLKSNGTKFVRFGKGTASQYLRTNAGATDLEWATIAGGGDVFLGQANDHGDFDNSFKDNRLRIWNPADTFRYTITAAAIAADRVLNLPLTTTADTLAALGMSSQTWTGTNIYQGKVELNKNIHHTGAISPTQITSDQNNYTPTNFLTSNVIRLDADSSFRTITGLGDATQTDGMRIILRNISANTILLSNQNTASTAANRFDFGGYDLPLFSKSEVSVTYDGTLARWTCTVPTTYIVPPMNMGYWYFMDRQTGSTADATSVVTAASGGTATGIVAEAKHTGITRFTSGTSATGSGSWGNLGNQLFLGNSCHWRYDTVIKIDTLSDGTNTYVLRCGFLDSGSAEPTDGVFFRYTHSVNSGKWELVARANSVETVTNATNTAVAAATWYRLTVIVNPAGTLAEFFQDGVSLGTVAANIPTAASRQTGFGNMFLKSAGTADINFVQMDSMQVIGYWNTSR